MKNELLDVMFASEKRKNTLLLLKDGAKEMEILLRVQDTTIQTLFPQIKILEKHHLVSHHKNVYKLTPVGKLLVDEMIPLLETLDVFDSDNGYWGTHNTDFIPPHLFKRIRNVRSCKIIDPPITELYALHKSFHLNKKTESVYKVTNFIYPDYHTIFTELIDSNVTVNYIVSKELLEKIKAEHYDDFKGFVNTNFFKLYVYSKKIDFLFITFDDFHIVMSLLSKDGDFDSKYIVCSTRDSLEWGKDLFDHYLKDSMQVTEI